MTDKVTKLIVNVVMWAALAGVMITALLFSSDLGDPGLLIPLVVVPLMFGGFVTLAMFAPAALPWVDANRLRTLHDQETGRSAVTPLDDGKRKRDTGGPTGDERLDLLMRLLTPEERDALKRELKRRVLDEATVGADGEIDYGGLSLNQLIDDDAPPSRASRR